MLKCRGVVLYSIGMKMDDDRCPSELSYSLLVLNIYQFCIVDLTLFSKNGMKDIPEARLVIYGLWQSKGIHLPQ